MYILIFEPHKGCRKVLLDKRAEKINLGRSLRDGYEYRLFTRLCWSNNL